MKLKYLIICMLPGIIIITMSVSGFAQVPVTTVETAETVDAPEMVPIETKPSPLRTKADKLIISGAVLTAVGGASLIVFGAVQATQDGYIELLTLPGLQIGGIVLATGIVVLSVGLAKRKKMKRNSLAFDIKTKHGKVTLEPTFAASENGGIFGLSGRF
jgi:hypothetical protein